jgi:hypothetical protein
MMLFALAACLGPSTDAPPTVSPTPEAPAAEAPRPVLFPGDGGDWSSLDLDTLGVLGLTGARGEARFELPAEAHHSLPEQITARFVSFDWALSTETARDDMRVWTYRRGDQRWELGVLRLPGMPNARGSLLWSTTTALPAWSALGPPEPLATVCRPIACSFTYAAGSTQTVWAAWSKSLDAAGYTLEASVGTSEQRRRGAERLDLTLVEGPEGLLVTVMICVEDGQGGCAPRP